MYNTGFNTNYSWMYQPYNYGWNNSMNNFTPYMNLNNTFSFNTNPWNTNYGFQPSINTQMPIMNTQVNTNSQITTSNPSFTSTKTEEPTKKDEEQEGLSTGAKWGIGLSIAAAVAIGVEVFAFKGKHLEKVWNKIKGVADDIPNSSNTPDVPNTPTKPPSGPATPPSVPTIPPFVDDGVEFKNLDEAKDYFKKFGINTEFTSGAERHLNDLNHIKKDLAILQKNGVECPKPSSIVLTDWQNPAELEEICRKMNFSDEAIRDLSAITGAHPGYWGTVEYLKDGQNVVFINHSFNGDFGAFMHEMGHLHQDLETSFWHSVKDLKGESFKALQHYILGLPEPTNIAPCNVPEYSRMSLVDIFRNSMDDLQILKDPSIKNQLDSLFPELNGNYKSLFNVPITNADGNVDIYILSAKKMIEKMASESNVYAPDVAFENVAEIFQKLNQGHQFSDEVMLMYDFCGGGRVPNLVINNMKYDDYIASLYQNKELLQKLRDCIEIKRL